MNDARPNEGLMLSENGDLPHLAGPCDKDDLALGQHAANRALDLTRIAHGATSCA